jgi:hypothetical protein
MTIPEMTNQYQNRYYFLVIFIHNWKSILKVSQEDTVEIVEYPIDVISIIHASMTPSRATETLQLFDHLLV